MPSEEFIHLVTITAISLAFTAICVSYILYRKNTFKE